MVPRYPKITPPLLPMPRAVRWHKADIQLPSPFILKVSSEDLMVLGGIIQGFIQKVEEQVGISVDIDTSEVPYEGFHCQITTNATRFRHEQAYRLEISEQAILLESKSKIGAAYALQTLLQIFLFSGRTVPTCYITDHPDVKIRGVHLDLFDGGIPQQHTMEELITLMSALKLNKLELFCVDEVSQTQISDLQIFFWQKFAQERMVEMSWHRASRTNTQDTETCYVHPKRSAFTGIQPTIQDLSILNQEYSGYSLQFQEVTEKAPTFLFMTYSLLAWSSMLWCQETNKDQDGHAWLDEIYFHERSGSAASLCHGLIHACPNHQEDLQHWVEERFFGPNLSRSNRPLTENELIAWKQWRDNVIREVAQLEYLEFQRVGGKWFLNELQHTCQWLLIALDDVTNPNPDHHKIEKALRTYRDYRNRRYVAKTTALFRSK